MRTRTWILALALAFAIASLMYVMQTGVGERTFFRPTGTQLPLGATMDILTTSSDHDEEDIEKQRSPFRVIAEDLEIPWEVVILPGGDLLVTERPGRVARIGGDGVVHHVEGVHHIGEGGLLGMALHPAFEQNRWLYLYMTTLTDEGIENRVQRYIYEDDILTEDAEIIEGIPGAKYHDGGRIAFGPDGMLYITTGDGGVTGRARRTDSLAGKILRVRDDGSIPEDNPFGNEVWTFGHRNPQGIAWDAEGRLWSVEHGRSGIRSGLDEINLIEKGKDYGWPTIEGDEIANGMEAPFMHSGADDTWAPADVTVLDDGSLLFTGLRGESLYQASSTQDGDLEVVAHFRGDFGRIRAVVPARDGGVYITTSDRDGRGTVDAADDRIIWIDTAIFSSNPAE